MEKLLKPGKQEILPEKAETAKIYDYWWKTFVGVLGAVEAAAENQEDVNKPGLLTDFLTHQTYAFIADEATYDRAMEALKTTYHKRWNIVFASRCGSSADAAELQHHLKIGPIQLETIFFIVS